LIQKATLPNDIYLLTIKTHFFITHQRLIKCLLRSFSGFGRKKREKKEGILQKYEVFKNK
jgi:hypothetical protein